jgi:putative membrane protein
MSLIVSWLVLSLAVYLAAVLVPDVHLRDFGSAVIVAGLFGVLNFFLG